MPHPLQTFTRVAPALFGALLGAAALSAHAAPAPHSMKLDFVTHASFFSKETKLAQPLDPQVFVKEARAPAGTGPQKIHHVAGFRPLHLDDPATTRLFNAEGQPLHMTAGRWLGAKGQVTITPAHGGADVVAHFTGLKPKGVYSLFENHFDVQPIAFTPLDGTGSKNSFVAKSNGAATIHVHAPRMLTSANAVLLVYHSDGKTHGQSRGTIGLTAHHQLIAPIP